MYIGIYIINGSNYHHPNIFKIIMHYHAPMPKRQWITGNTAGFYLNVNEYDLRRFRKDPENKDNFRESKTSTPSHTMYEYKIDKIKKYLKTEGIVPDHLVRE